jgi:hypothetical protein
VLSFKKENKMENIVSIPTDPYEVVDEKWKLVDYGRKGGVLEKKIKW